MGDVLVTGQPGSETDVDAVVAEFGADALRLAMAFAAPPAQTFAWSDYPVQAAARWLSRFRDIADKQTRLKDKPAADVTDEPRRAAHRTIAACETALADGFALNTCVARIMGFVQALADADSCTAEALDIATLMLYPVVPETCAAHWLSRHGGDIEAAAWPRIDVRALAPGTVELAVQVNGRLRGRVVSRPNVSIEVVQKLARDAHNVTRYLSGKTVHRVFYVPDKLINFVVS